MTLQIEILNHSTSPVHKLIKIIVRGRVYAATSAEPVWSKNPKPA